MSQKIRKGLLLFMSLVMLMPAVRGFAATPKQEALKAYNRWLSNAKVQVMPKGYIDYDRVQYTPTPASNTEFAIAYINNDAIPELIVRSKDCVYCSVLTYKNGKIVRIWQNYFYNSVKGYYSKTGMFVDKRTPEFARIADYQNYMLMSPSGSVTKRFDVLVSSTQGSKSYEYYSPKTKKWTSLKNHTEFRKKLLTFTKGKALTPVRYYRNTAANRNSILK